MNIIKFDTREGWEAARAGRITGSKIGDIYSSRGTRKKGTYQLIADRVCLPPDSERPMDRGTRLEDEALARFTQETGKKLDTSLVMWTREDNQNIAVSPDAMVVDNDFVFSGEEACEVKCLNSADHIAGFITQKLPKDYEEQVAQYFAVNDLLAKLYFIFYDPRSPCDFFYLTVNRQDVADDVELYLACERQELAFADEWIKKLTY